MKRRLIAAIAAVVLAGVGAVLLLNYVSAADERAVAGVQATTVLVVAAPIPKGTPTDQLGQFVTASSIPANVVATGAITSLEEVTGQVTTVDLQPGEQLLRSRFADPQSTTAPTALTIPPGMQQVTILLEPQRVIGGNLASGDRVSVYVTSGAETKLVLSSALVSKVQGGLAQPAAQPQDGAAATPAPAPADSAAPSGSIMVTFALSPADTQTLISSAEHSAIWLSLEGTDGQ